MPRPRLVLTLMLAMMASPLAAQNYGPQPDADTQREVLALRETAWRSWFSNDRAAFQQVVPDELVALGWGGGPWEDRTQTMAQMEEFAKSGNTLATLEFPRTVFQRYGEVVILYTSFRVVIRDAAGNLQETAGRGTEVFVRRSGRWVHTGWHLDTVTD